MVELLAPARDKRSLMAAINNKADSIYVGVEGYNMRANVANIAVDEIKDYVDICHDHDVKLYVCTNTIVDDMGVELFKSQLPKLESFNVDALIISDMGLINIANKSSIPLHLSIQANTTNTEALKLYKDLGISRAVLSRELSLQQIKEIKKNSPIEIETFIHGAMCVAISGRCFLSSYFYDRNANCGECLQPCRQEWKLSSTEDKELILTQPENNSIEHSRLLSPRDMCMIEHVDDLIDAGIDAFKIEGRARAADYVATVTHTYHEAIKLYEEELWNEKSQQLLPGWMEELSSVFNRGFDTGFYYRVPKKMSFDNKATYKKIDIGQVTNYYKKVGVAEIKLWSKLSVGDEIIIQGNKTGSVNESVKSMQVDGENIKTIDSGLVGIKVDNLVRENDHVYLKKDIKED
ncbi:MAG: peptidase U32 family protein [Methanosphaera sp.]|uniref:peptidase U32 family protein n=1 Tax=Methanosphaera sp. TaxID=2666342 RepID=UPI0025D475EC|nr:peptidase U32 family protein [Methanosphaera sp.]MCI5867215.1 U32 family peptidase [Methanosphaera sp.]MDD6534717.1 U32 family peptidase [Methanosphaera sp.]MDY3955615.1 peptidase U32 family protein [Methanosphaera sp.]